MSTGKRYNLCHTAMAFVYEDLGQMEESNSEVPIDRISSLPDELLINILNFLPINCAITTSILSTRWTNLFKEVTRLDIDDSFLSDSHSAFRYVSCICKMLDVAKLSNLISFRLNCKRCQLATVILCLDVMAHHRIQEIDLCIRLTFRFPDSMFTCKTLRILKLTDCFAVYNVPDTVCLPCLKILHLKKIGMLNADNISRICRILSGCPLLQEFLMTPLNWHKLTLGKALVVSPLLQFFHYEDNLAESYSIKTSNYLVEAHLGIPIEFDYVKDLSRVSRSARDLVQAVSSVKCLFLSADCIQALTSVQDELPILHNLTKLKLGCSKNPHLTLLRLLGIAPNLEELIFSEGLFPVPLGDIFPVEQDYWGSGRAAPSCFKTHLKIIEIEHLTGLKQELRIVEYLLRNSHVLEQLIIHKWVGSEEKFKIRKQLKGLAKRWNKCVKFCELYL